MSQRKELIDQLLNEWLLLQRRWGEIRSEWKDSQAEQFEKRFWQELRERTDKYLRLAKEIDDKITKIERRL